MFWAQRPSRRRNRIGKGYSIDLDMHPIGLGADDHRVDVVD